MHLPMLTICGNISVGAFVGAAQAHTFVRPVLPIMPGPRTTPEVSKEHAELAPAEAGVKRKHEPSESAQAVEHAQPQLAKPAAGGANMPLHLHTLGLALLQLAEHEGVITSPAGGMPIVRVDSKARRLTICRVSPEEFEAIKTAKAAAKPAQSGKAEPDGAPTPAAPAVPDAA